MLKRIVKLILKIAWSIFAGAGVGFSAIIGAIRLSGGIATFEAIPRWVAYLMVYASLIAFTGGCLWLIIILLIDIYKRIRKLIWDRG